MHDLVTLPDDPNPSASPPRWVKVVLIVPYAAFLIAAIGTQAAETIPALAGPSWALLVVASAGAAVGFGSVLIACLFHQVRKSVGGGRAASGR